MAKNYVQDGQTIHYTNDTGSDIASGDPVVAGSLLGVAVTDIANGHSGAVIAEGVVEMPKAAGAIGQGDAVDFDISEAEINGDLTPAAGDLIGCAVAWEAAESGDETVKVKLNPGTATVHSE